MFLDLDVSSNPCSLLFLGVQGSHEEEEEEVVYI